MKRIFAYLLSLLLFLCGCQTKYLEPTPEYLLENYFGKNDKDILSEFSFSSEESEMYTYSKEFSVENHEVYKLKIQIKDSTLVLMNYQFAFLAANNQTTADAISFMKKQWSALLKAHGSSIFAEYYGMDKVLSIDSMTAEDVEKYFDNKDMSVEIADVFRINEDSVVIISLTYQNEIGYLLTLSYRPMYSSRNVN